MSDAVIWSVTLKLSFDNRNIFLVQVTELFLQQGTLTEGGGLSTVDLLVTSLDQLLFILKLLFALYKTTYLNKEVNCTEPSPSVFPGYRSVNDEENRFEIPQGRPRFD